MSDDEALVEEVELVFELGPIKAKIKRLPRPLGPVTAILTIGGSIMPGTITVDTTNEQAAVNYVDDKGDTDAPAPEGAVVTYVSDNPAVATVDPTSGKVAPVAEGTANISATIADAAGQPILEPDGVTPFSVQPVAVTVGPGAAVGAGLSLSV
jgi:hypothetical protein